MDGTTIWIRVDYVERCNGNIRTGGHVNGNQQQLSVEH